MCMNISSKFVLNIPHINTLSEEGIWVDISFRGCMHAISFSMDNLQRPDICVHFSGMFAPNILERRCTAVTRYVLHIPWNISTNVANPV